jgi:hypothetical protein
MLDTILDWAAVFLPTLLSIGGVLVSIKAPQSKHHKAWRVGLVALGVAISAITAWQQSRSRSAHAAEVGGLNTRLTTLAGNVESLKQQQVSEIARRQQAERDLTIIVQATGRSTREGVSEDIKKAPIKIEVNGQVSADPAKTMAIRTKLGELLERNETIKATCFAKPVPNGFSCLAATNGWYSEVIKYISQNMEISYRARLSSATGVSLSWTSNGIGLDNDSNAALNILTFKAAALAEFIKEQH